MKIPYKPRFASEIERSFSNSGSTSIRSIGFRGRKFYFVVFRLFHSLNTSISKSNDSLAEDQCGRAIVPCVIQFRFTTVILTRTLVPSSISLWNYAFSLHLWIFSFNTQLRSRQLIRSKIWLAQTFQSLIRIVKNLQF
jgi:hypothetical protein